MNKFVLVFIIIVGFGGWWWMNVRSKTQLQPSPQPTNNLIISTMKLTSPGFASNEFIPAKYTCDGENVNPPLTISDVPITTQNLVLIVDDPDAPAGDWVHWLAWNILPQTSEIPENGIPKEAIQGKTDFGDNKYGGPCPPSGTHRYQFKLYALDTKLNLSTSTHKQELESAMQGHILEQTLLVGLYKRS